ncbi:hypothetical protein M514_14686 [Trichuris suis]|uniref:Core Histone H2A/H2B/H3 domain-containing protein n=1 Tax=Trichuris suis TaxID=68888 RepID=A0A085NV50_9BILA|nr:hypothetical protein M514_14686 [Trichuris suis]
MSMINSIVNDVFDRISTEASRLSQYSNRDTISSREIQTAAPLLLPGELSKHVTVTVSVQLLCGIKRTNFQIASYRCRSANTQISRTGVCRRYKLT